jgi:prophage regulatory protein
MHPIEFLATLPPEAFARLPMVIALSGLKRSAIYDQVKRGRFPKPVKLTEHASGWRVRDIQEWLKDPTAWRQTGARKGA